MILDLFAAAYPPDFGQSLPPVATPETDLRTQLVARAGGLSFGDGILRVHSLEESERARLLIADVFPRYRGCTPVAKDWLGRQFVLNPGSNDVLLVEPGSLGGFHTDCSLDALFDEAMIRDPSTFLAADLFAEWIDLNDGAAQLQPNQCVSFKQPLFVGGRGTVENLETADEDVYWAVVASLKELLR